MKNGYEIAKVLTEGKWFEVKPLSIDQKLFEKAREDEKQEATRKLIIEAFEEMEKSPEKYARNFQTMIPKKEWRFKTITQLKEIACELGDHNADWIEQALEWAQRIQNGETWEAICNVKDTANWYRLVVWKNGYTRLVGGSLYDFFCDPASSVYDNTYGCLHGLLYAVPLVVSYEE